MYQDTLVPGAIWVRNKTASKSKVLFITNLNLSEQTQADFPPQVIFVTEKNPQSVLSQPVASFVKQRSFFTMDLNLEASLEYLLAEPEEESTDTSLIDSVEVPEQVIEVRTTEANTHLATINVGPHENAEYLTNNFVSYSEEPYHTGDTLHKLTFVVDPELSNLQKIGPSFEVSNDNSVQVFTINVAQQTIKVEVSGYLQTFVNVDQSGVTATVYLVSEGDFRADSRPTYIDTTSMGTTAPASLGAHIPVPATPSDAVDYQPVQRPTHIPVPPTLDDDSIQLRSRLAPMQADEFTRPQMRVPVASTSLVPRPRPQAPIAPEDVTSNTVRPVAPVAPEYTPTFS